MNVISLLSSSDDEDEHSNKATRKSPFVTTKTTIEPQRKSGGFTKVVTTVQRRDSTTLNTSVDLDTDIYDLLGTDANLKNRRNELLRSKREQEVAKSIANVSKPTSEKSRAKEILSRGDAILRPSGADSWENEIWIDDESSKSSTSSIFDDVEFSSGYKPNANLYMENKKHSSKKRPIEKVSETSDLESSDKERPKTKRKGKTRMNNASQSQGSDSDTRTSKRRKLDYTSSDYSSSQGSQSTGLNKDYAKRAKGYYALHEIVIHVDADLIASVGGKVIQEQLSLQFENIVVQESSIAYGVRWTRRLPVGYCQKFNGQEPTDPNEDKEYHLDYQVIRMPGDTLVDLVKGNNLIPYVEAVKENLKQESRILESEIYPTVALHSTRIIIIVEGLQTFLKSIEQAKYRKILSQVRSKSKQQQQNNTVDTSVPSIAVIEKALLELQLGHDVRIFETNNANATASFLSQMTKNIAQAPYKRQTSALDFKTSSSNSIPFEDRRKKLKLSEVWCKQLMEIPSVSEKIARTVVAKYGSVKRLLEAYDRTDKGVSMLRDIKCEWGIGEGSRLDKSTVRKIGPVASAKIFSLFGNEAKDRNNDDQM